VAALTPMGRVLLALLVTGLLVGGEIAAPQPVSTADLPEGIGVVRRCTWHGSSAVATDLLTVVLAPGRHRLRLVDQSPAFPLGARSVAMTLAGIPGAVVAVNGGYFERDFQPAGLCLLEGRTVTPLALQGVLSGIAAIDARGALHLLPRQARLEGMYSAIQAGPFLIDPGGTIGVRARPARARRTVIAQDPAGVTMLLVTGDLTLHEVAALLHAHAPVLGLARVERALNLDGGPSTGLAVAVDGGWSFPERGPVRNVLVVSPAVP
jgi:uncharacterized protein YigE (DUF2233 family)